MIIKMLIERYAPQYRLCRKRWCLRGMTYQYRCWKHQELP